MSLWYHHILEQPCGPATLDISYLHLSGMWTFKPERVNSEAHESGNKTCSQVDTRCLASFPSGEQETRWKTIEQGRIMKENEQ